MDPEKKEFAVVPRVKAQGLLHPLRATLCTDVLSIQMARGNVNSPEKPPMPTALLEPPFAWS